MLNFNLKEVLNNLKYWFVTVSRGYSAPMSILNWLVVFLIALFNNGNFSYGILALVGILVAHLGTNLLDDCVDYYLKSPKQECKTQYLEQGFVSIKFVAIITLLHFGIASAIGLFFFIKLGLPILIFAGIAAMIILLYPRLNHFALGELAVGSTFGVLLFAGVYYVMLNEVSLNIILISIPVSLLTVAVVYTHALMDYDFDKISGKKTLCIALGSKEKGLWGLVSIYTITLITTTLLVLKNILPPLAIASFLLVIPICKLKKQLTQYSQNTPQKNDFMKNFILSRNISLYYNIIIILCTILGEIHG